MSLEDKRSRYSEDKDVVNLDNTWSIFMLKPLCFTRVASLFSMFNKIEECCFQNLLVCLSMSIITTLLILQQVGKP